MSTLDVVGWGGASVLLCGHELGELDGVERGALQEVVADDPEVEALRVTEVLADAADDDLVAAGIDAIAVSVVDPPTSTDAINTVAAFCSMTRSSGSRVCSISNLY